MKDEGWRMNRPVRPSSFCHSREALAVNRERVSALVALALAAWAWVPAGAPPPPRPPPPPSGVRGGGRCGGVFAPAAWPGGRGKRVEVGLARPKVERKPTTVVAHVSPSADRLPENRLKFSLHFSAPMSRGGSYRHIKLLDGKGK